MIEVFEGHRPVLHATSFAAASASLVGRVVLEAQASVWHGSVLRADEETIRVGPRTNVQDLTVIHVAPGAPTLLGAGVTIGHRAVLHSCTVEDASMVGIGAILLDGVHVESGAVVAAGAVVAPGKRVRSGELWAGVPARPVREVRPEELAFIRDNAANYVELAARFRG